LSAAIVRTFSLSKPAVISGRSGRNTAGIVTSSTSHLVTVVTLSAASSA
jgi:hypothetical protein